MTGARARGGALAARASGREWELHSFLELGALPSAVPCARLHAVHVMHEWGLQSLTDDVALVVSELITNAIDASIVLPGRPPVALRLLTDGTSLAIEVWDRSPLDVEFREAGADAECGRGLTVVAALSERWGWQRTGDGRKVVWAEIATAGGASAVSEAEPASDDRSGQQCAWVGGSNRQPLCMKVGGRPLPRPGSEFG